MGAGNARKPSWTKQKILAAAKTVPKVLAYWASSASRGATHFRKKRFVIFEPNSELPSICFRAHTPILVPMIAAASALAVLADGGLTLYIQRDSPGKDKEPNWLPAPSGPFLMFMRRHWPKPDALDGTSKRPPLQRTNS